MRKDLIREAYLLVLNIPAESINMEHWVGGCGTIGCAAGHMASSGIFRAEGLRLEEQSLKYDIPVYYGTEKITGVWGFFHKERSVRLTSYNALAKVLDIPIADAKNLFSKIGLRKPGATDKDVFLDRIRAYAKKYDIALDEVQPANAIASEAIRKAAGYRIDHVNGIERIREDTGSTPR